MTSDIIQFTFCGFRRKHVYHLRFYLWLFVAVCGVFHGIHSTDLFLFSFCFILFSFFFSFFFVCQVAFCNIVEYNFDMLLCSDSSFCSFVFLLSLCIPLSFSFVQHFQFRMFAQNKRCPGIYGKCSTLMPYWDNHKICRACTQGIKESANFRFLQRLSVIFGLRADCPQSLASCGDYRS